MVTHQECEEDQDYPTYPSYANARAAANEVLNMFDEIQYLRRENEELKGYRQKYIDLLDGSIKHNEQMIVGLLSVAVRMDTPEAQAE
jgi:hypothetical protein